MKTFLFITILICVLTAFYLHRKKDEEWKWYAFLTIFNYLTLLLTK